MIAESIIVKWTVCYFITTRQLDLEVPEAKFIRALNPNAVQKEFVTLVSRSDRRGVLVGSDSLLYSQESATLAEAQNTHTSVVRTLADGGSLGRAT